MGCMTTLWPSILFQMAILLFISKRKSRRVELSFITRAKRMGLSQSGAFKKERIMRDLSVRRMQIKSTPMVECAALAQVWKN